MDFQKKEMMVNEIVGEAIERLPMSALLTAFLKRWNINEVSQDLYKRVRKSKKKVSRNALSRGLRRTLIKKIDDDKCIYCDTELGEEYEIDHFRSIDASGDIDDTLYNLFTACKRHNRQKQDKKYDFMYDEIIEKRKDFLFSMINTLWLSRKGRIALKSMFATYEEVRNEENVDNGDVEDDG